MSSENWMALATSSGRARLIRKRVVLAMKACLEALVVLSTVARCRNDRLVERPA
jgi:hypothetical protein